MELLRIGKDKRALKFCKKRVSCILTFTCLSHYYQYYSVHVCDVMTGNNKHNINITNAQRLKEIYNTLMFQALALCRKEGVRLWLEISVKLRTLPLIFEFIIIHQRSPVYSLVSIYTPIPKIVVRAKSNKQETDDRKGHWDFVLIHSSVDILTT